MSSVRGTIVIGGYTLLDGVVTPNAGACWVVLNHWDERTSPETQIQAIVNSLNTKFRSIKGAMVFAVRPPPIQGLGAVGGFEMQVRTLRLLADKLVELEVVESISHQTVGEELKKTRSNRG